MIDCRFPSNTSDEAKETHQDTTQAIIPTALHSRVMASVFPDAGSDIRQACIYRCLLLPLLLDCDTHALSPTERWQPSAASRRRRGPVPTR